MGDHNNYCSDSFFMRSYESITEDIDKNCEGLDITINNEKDVLLIDLIKGYPHLYDKSLKNYKDQLMKEKSWLEISEIMQLSGNLCQLRWTRLRERYSKERRQRQKETRSGSGISNRVVWPLYDSMKFFEKHIAKRNTYSNLSQQTNNKENIRSCSQSIQSFQSSQNSSAALAVISPPDSVTSTLNGNQQHSLFSATNPCSRKPMSTFQQTYTFTATPSTSIEIPATIERSERRPSLQQTCTFTATPSTSIEIPATIERPERRPLLQQTCTSTATPTSIEIPAIIERPERRQSMSSIKSSHGSTTRTLFETNANRDKCYTPKKKQRNSESDKIEDAFLSLTNQLSDKINNPHPVAKSRIENIKGVDDKFGDFIVAELQNWPQELRQRKKKQIIDIVMRIGESMEN